MFKTTLFALSSTLLVAVAGCAADGEPVVDEQEPVVAQPETSSSVDPKLAGPCTTSSSCDANYCCTTVDCRFTTTITCTPKVKTTK